MQALSGPDAPWLISFEPMTFSPMTFSPMTFSPMTFGVSLLSDSSSLITVAGFGLLALGLGLSIFNLQRCRKALFEALRKKGDLEQALNEAETALYSDSQIMLVWRSAGEQPDHMIGAMHGAAQVPENLAAARDFAQWLEADSQSELSIHLAHLKQSGKAFNIGVKTLKGELLEADGRAAGAHATLRLRPLAGDRKQMTELSYDASKLSLQVQRLSAMLDSAPFPAWIKAEDGKLIWVNRAYITALEAHDLQAVLKTNMMLFRDEAIDHSKAQGKLGIIGRGRAVLKGAMRSFNVYEQQIAGGVSGFAIDMTALEDTEKELERHIKAHASTLDKLDTAIAIFGPDQHLRFFNQAYATLWSLDTAWLKTQPNDGEILDRLRASRSLPEQANFREWKSKQLSSYTTLEIREAYWYLPDGRSLHVVCEQHPFGGVTYLYENLTKEYQLESKYNELFNVQRETLDNLAEAVALFGSDGRLKLFNPAFEHLWHLDEVKAANLHLDQMALDKSYSPEARSSWQDIRYGVTGIDGSRQTLDGQFGHDRKDLKFRAVPLPDGNTLLTFTDVSDAVRAEKALVDKTEALEAADRLKSNFLAHVSYEIRTPLTSISGFAEALDLGIPGALSGRQRDYVMNIRRSSDELSNIIDAIIDLSAIDAGAMELKLAMADVAELLQRAANRILPALERRDLNIKIEIASDVTNFMADATRVEQVLGHLLSNAIGFSSPGNTITLGAKLRGEMMQIWVRDQGRGIAPDFQGKAFERFQSKPLPGGHRGPGLGLAIVKSFTELHGGRVALLSKLDSGTTVICDFPLEGPNPLALAEPQSAA